MPGVSARVLTMRHWCGVPLCTPYEAPQLRHVYHLYVVRTTRRDALLEHLRAHGVGVGIHYPIPLNRQPVYLRCGYADVRLPKAETGCR